MTVNESDMFVVKLYLTEGLSIKIIYPEQER